MAAGSMSVEKTERKNSIASGTPPVQQRKATIRVVARLPGEKGPRSRVIVSIGAGEELDVTGALTASLAHALWQLQGGVDIGNWVDGEALLDQLLIVPPSPPVEAPVSQVVVPGKRTVARR
jgi:hypothetical protein